MHANEKGRLVSRDKYVSSCDSPAIAGRESRDEAGDRGRLAVRRDSRVVLGRSAVTVEKVQRGNT